MLTEAAIRRAMEFERSYGGSRQHFFGREPRTPSIERERSSGTSGRPARIWDDELKMFVHPK